MENKKYEITTNELVIDGRKFFQVKALKDFDNAKAGDLGGYVENEVVAYPAPHGTEYSYTAAIVASTTKDQWCFRGDDGMIEVTSREIDSLLPELIGPKFATYMQFIRDAHHSIYDIELFEEDFE